MQPTLILSLAPRTFPTKGNEMAAAPSAPARTNWRREMEFKLVLVLSERVRECVIIRIIMNLPPSRQTLVSSMSCTPKRDGARFTATPAAADMNVNSWNWSRHEESTLYTPPVFGTLGHSRNFAAGLRPPAGPIHARQTERRRPSHARPDR